jgi:UDP-N-acetylmuramoyl-tripeptide--D-alanyl-D-alanine ligase
MFTIEEIIESTSGELTRGSSTAKTQGVCIDSRTIKRGELFIAIKGNRFDGHNFINSALRKQAGGVLFSDARFAPPKAPTKKSLNTPLIKVKDTKRALAELAYYHRKRFKIPVVAITGSNGKTTTKEMASLILAKRFNLLCNPGTENNLIGVALTILRLRPRHQLAVIEIGANHAGEIARLSWIIQPSIGIITNIGPAHLEFFKSLGGVFRAKTELLKNLDKKAKLIINNDDRFLSGLDRLDQKRVTFGINRPADFSARIVKQTEAEIVFLLNKRRRISLNILGRHNVYNALASIACARNLGIDLEHIKEALADFRLPPMRMQMLKANNIKIINDCYNANPQSLTCALDCLSSLPSRGKRIAICADMLELGRSAQRLHADLGKRLAKERLDVLITVGELARHIARGARLAGMDRAVIHSFDSRQQALKLLPRIVASGDIVLVKGSRAMKMEKILGCFINSSIH